MWVLWAYDDGFLGRNQWAQKGDIQDIIGPKDDDIMELLGPTCVRQEVAILGLMEVNQLLAAAMFVDK